MPPGKFDGCEWTTVKRRRESHKKDAIIHIANAEKTNGAVKPVNSHKDHQAASRSKYENATESSTCASTGASRSASPSSAGTGRGATDVASGRNKSRTQRAQPEQLCIEADAFLSKVSEAEERYGHDALVQLQFLTDYLVTHFRSSKLPLNKLVLEQSLDKVRARALRGRPLSCNFLSFSACITFVYCVMPMTALVVCRRQLRSPCKGSQETF